MKGKAKQIKYALIGLALIAVILSAAYFYRKSGRTTADLMNYSELVGHIDHGDIKSALIQPNEVTVTLNEGRIYRVTIFPNLQLTSLADHVHEKNPAAAIKFEVPEERIQTNEILLMGFVFLCIVGFLFAVRQMRSGNGIASSFGQNRAKLQPSQNGRITFSDVAGVEEATAELSEIVDFLKQPQRFQSVGGRIPKGVLLMGPPGTGKTLLARAIAGEANVPFFSISGSDFVEMYVGVGASRVRGLFNQAKKKAPCIIFIDEIDSIGRQRGASSGGASDEREQTLNQLLVEMDGFEANKGIILIGSTNRPDILDNALLRPGRFDRRVMVDRPDVRGREQILAVHARKVPLDTDVRISVIARGTPGFTGADLANLINEAALNAARQNRKTVLMSDFEMAKDKVLMGAERRSAIISDDEKRTTAYHEAGHTLVGLKVPNADPIHKVTIIPRGMALGVTQQLPEGDRYLQTRDFIEGQIAILMGGRIAEEVFLGQMTTGASNDIERATELARKMVCKFGMSSLGPLSFLKQNDEALQSHSEDTAIRIDQEVSRIITEQYNRARCMITENRTALVRLAEALLIQESLDGLQIRRIVAGHATDGVMTLPLTNEDDMIIAPQPLPKSPIADVCPIAI